MPNIKNWIDRQLKKGYSIKQIKDILIRRGYSSKIVTQVDSFNIIKSEQQKTKKQKISKKYIFIAFAIIIIFVVALNYFSDDAVIEVLDDIQNYTIYSGNYVGIEDNYFILEKEGKEIRVIHEAPKRYTHVYKRLKNGDEVLLSDKGDEPEVGTPILLYTIIEDNQQKIKTVVIFDQEELT